MPHQKEQPHDRQTLYRMGPHRCPYCSYVASHRETLTKHVREKHRNRDRTIQCSVCPYQVDAGRRANLRRHYRNKHSGANHKSHRESQPHRDSDRKPSSPWNRDPDVEVREPSWEDLMSMVPLVSPLPQEQLGHFPDFLRSSKPTATVTAREAGILPSLPTVQDNQDDSQGVLTTPDQPATTALTGNSECPVPSEGTAAVDGPAEPLVASSESPGLLNNITQNLSRLVGEEMLWEHGTVNLESSLTLIGDELSASLSPVSATSDYFSEEVNDQVILPLQGPEVAPPSLPYSAPKLNQAAPPLGAVYESIHAEPGPDTKSGVVIPLEADPRCSFLGAPSLYSRDPQAAVLRQVRAAARSSGSRVVTQRDLGTGVIYREEEAVMSNRDRYRLTATWISRPSINQVEVTRHQAVAAQTEATGEAYNTEMERLRQEFATETDRLRQELNTRDRELQEARTEIADLRTHFVRQLTDIQSQIAPKPTASVETQCPKPRSENKRIQCSILRLDLS